MNSELQKSKITRNQNGSIYLDQKALQESKVSFFELKFDFSNIPPEYGINHFTIEEMDFFAEKNSKEFCFNDFSITFNPDYAVNKLTLMIAIKDKGIGRLKKLGADRIRYNLTVCFPSKLGSSPLIRKETLNKIDDLTLR